MITTWLLAPRIARIATSALWASSQSRRMVCTTVNESFRRGRPPGRPEGKCLAEDDCRRRPGVKVNCPKGKRHRPQTACAAQPAKPALSAKKAGLGHWPPYEQNRGCGLWERRSGVSGRPGAVPYQAHQQDPLDQGDCWCVLYAFKNSRMAFSTCMTSWRKLSAEIRRAPWPRMMTCSRPSEVATRTLCFFPNSWVTRSM